MNDARLTSFRTPGPLTGLTVRGLRGAVDSGDQYKLGRGSTVEWVMGCRHEGFHEARAKYDHGLGVLVFYWTCERCGTRLSEFRREAYRPHFDPRATSASRASRNEMTTRTAYWT